MNNLMDVYINFTTKKIKKYMKIIFGEYMNEKVVDEYIKTYVNARYYNVMQSEDESTPFYLKISNELKNKEKILHKRMDEEDASIITYTKRAFDYVVFFDSMQQGTGSKKNDTVKEVVEKMAKMREQWFKIRRSSDFVDKLYTEVKEDIQKKEEFLDKCNNDDFILTCINHSSIKNLYYVKIENNIRMPIQYSDFAVNKVFNSGLIAEDKLKIEYIMLSAMSIRDILHGNYEDIYIAEFNANLFKKKTKLEGMLSIIGNQALQEKINFNIMYEDYMANRTVILQYLNKGYNFAITLDSTLQKAEDVEKLKMFKHVIAPKNLPQYNEVKKYRFVIDQ